MGPGRSGETESGGRGGSSGVFLTSQLTNTPLTRRTESLPSQSRHFVVASNKEVESLRLINTIKNTKEHGEGLGRSCNFNFLVYFLF